jgi:hypothetical protein
MSYCGGVDRAKRRAKRTESRAEAKIIEEVVAKRSLSEVFVGELDSLFTPSRKQIHERKEWVAVAKMDDREAAGGAADLDKGTIELPRSGFVGPATA